MPKITRYSGNVVAFANNAQAGELFDFGSESDQNTDLDSLVNASYLRGWGIVGASDFPPLEWFNAQAFTSGQFISYLHQMGVPEWNVDQEYPTAGAQVVHSGGVWTRGDDWVIGDEPGVADSTRWAKGISVADLGTAAYVNTGTGAAEIPTNLDVDNRVSDIESDISSLKSTVTKKFTSSAQVISSAGLIVVAHGLTDGLGVPVPPFGIEFYIECILSDGSYTPGDKVVVAVINNSSSGISRVNSVKFDDTNITVRLSDQANAFSQGNSITGSHTVITNNKWQLYIKAWY